MSKITLTDLANLQNENTAVNAINTNNQIIELAFDNTLSRDGTAPNQMQANLDMNSNRIINLPAPLSSGEPVRLQDLTESGILVPGESGIYPSYVEAQTTVVPSTVTGIRVMGYYSAESLGAANWKRVSSQPSHGARLRTADRFLPNGSEDATNGGWWELNEMRPDASMLGADPTATGTVNRTAIHNCLQYLGGGNDGEMTIGPGTFLISSQITTPFRTSIRGAGRQQTFLSKQFNGDLIQLGSASNLSDLAILGNGATYTGRGVIMVGGSGSQWVRNVSITDTEGYSIEYTAQSAGTQGGIDSCSVSRTATGTVCIKYPDDLGVASPRWLLNTNTPGLWHLCDTDGADNLFVIGCFANNMTFGANSGKVIVWGTRLAATGGTVTVRGSNLIMDGCPVAGDIDWRAVDSAFGPNNIITGTVTDNSGPNPLNRWGVVRNATETLENKTLVNNGAIGVVNTTNSGGPTTGSITTLGGLGVSLSVNAGVSNIATPHTFYTGTSEFRIGRSVSQYMSFFNDASNCRISALTAVKNFLIQTSDAGPIVFGTNGVNRITISASSGDVTFTGALTGITSITCGAINATNSIRTSGVGTGIGYSTGAGGTVVQATNKSTGVTLNTSTGQITMNNASLAANTSVGFTLTNSAIAATDVVIVNIKSGAAADSYIVTVDAIAAGSCRISLRNITAGSLGEAVVLQYALIKGVNA